MNAAGGTVISIGPLWLTITLATITVPSVRNLETKMAPRKLLDTVDG